MPERPKRPLSSFMLWLNSARESIRKDNPDFKVTEVAKKGGELWRNMKDKSEWEAKAGVLKEEYAKQMKEFEKDGGDKNSGGAKKRGRAPPKEAAKKTKKEDSDEEDESD